MVGRLLHATVEGDSSPVIPIPLTREPTSPPPVRKSLADSRATESACARHWLPWAQNGDIHRFQRKRTSPFLALCLAVALCSIVGPCNRSQESSPDSTHITWLVPMQ